jgi:hypothetical protein
MTIRRINRIELVSNYPLNNILNRIFTPKNGRPGGVNLSYLSGKILNRNTTIYASFNNNTINGLAVTSHKKGVLRIEALGAMRGKGTPLLQYIIDNAKRSKAYYRINLDPVNETVAHFYARKGGFFFKKNNSFMRLPIAMNPLRKFVIKRTGR